MTDRSLAKEMEGTLGNSCKRHSDCDISFSDLSATGYVTGIDFLLIKFPSDILKKKNENDICRDRELSCRWNYIKVLMGSWVQTPGEMVGPSTGRRGMPGAGEWA